LKSVAILILGVVLGYMLHLILADESSAPVRSGDLGYVLNDSNKTVSEPELLDTELTGRESDGHNQASSELHTANATISNRQEVIEDCRLDRNTSLHCRDYLIRSAQRDLSASQLIEKLTLWLEDYPDDLEAGLLLVDTLVRDRRFLLAIDRLERIKSYQFEVEGIELLVNKVDSLIRSASRMFQDNNQLDGLVSLYQILIDAEPHEAKWRFELASVMQKTGQYDEALNLLSYILYDAEYGNKATKLTAELNAQLDPQIPANIPLVQSGSQFLVDAVINNAVSLRLLIDTGASITSIDRNVLDRLGLLNGPTTEGRLQTANGLVATRLVNLHSLGVGGFTVQNVQAATIQSLGGNLDGLLGMDFLSQFKFSIDQEDRVLFLGSKSGP